MGSNYPKAIEYLRVISIDGPVETDKMLYEIAKRTPSIIVKAYEALHPVTLMCDVIITGARMDNQKIQAIKTIREYLQLGLKESKDLIETPYPIHINISAPKSEPLAEALRACGFYAEARSK